MTFTLISIDQAHEWSEALGPIPHGYWHTVGAWRAIRGGTAEPAFLFSYTDVITGSRAAIPFSERIWQDTKDIYVPAGFGGFIANGTLNGIGRRWSAFAAGSGYVCGYFPLHPVACKAEMHDSVAAGNELFVLDIARGPEALFRGFDPDTRRLLRQEGAKDAGLVFDRARLESFIQENYGPFMLSVRANPASIWAPATLEAICADPNVLLVGAEDEHGICAAGMFGMTPFCADYLANVRVRGGKRNGAAIVWEAIKILAHKQIPWLNLGGGVTRDDGIARAKRRFGPTAVPMKVAKEIYQPMAFQRMIERAGIQFTEESRYFPPYRRSSHGAQGGGDL